MKVLFARLFPLVFAALASASAQTSVVRIKSKILGEERIVHVNLPPNYSLAHQRYNVIYLLDGHVRQFFDVTVASAAYDLIGDAHDYAPPPQIVIGVDQRDRGEDLSKNQEQFTRFLTEELVPFVDRQYRTTGYRTLIGHSLGGRFALMTFCRAPRMFGSVIAISAAGGDSTSSDALTKCLTSAFLNDSQSLHQLVLAAGGKEQRLLAGVERLRAFLTAKAPINWRWTVIDEPGLAHTDTPLATIPPGIRFTQDKSVWQIPSALADSIVAGSVNPEQRVGEFYKTLNARLGATVSPSLQWMLASARAHARQRDAQEESSIRALIDAYPEDLEGYGLLADLMIRRGESTAARRALSDARRMLDKLDMHDEYERERKRKFIDDVMASIARAP